MKSYRSLFETVDKETTNAITERITTLKKKLKTSLSDTKVYRGQVSDKSVDAVKKEVELIQKDIDKIITSTENRVAEVQGTLNTENASTKILSNEQELQKNTDIVNDKLEKFEGIATSEAWFKFAGSLGQIGTGVYAVGNAVMSLTDESLSP